MDIVNKVFYIEVEPMYMTSNIYDAILSKIREKYINTCSEKDGYILDISKINHIEISGINDCSNHLFFKVDCEIQILFPTIGKKIDCGVDMIFQHGIFAGFENLKVLVPVSMLNKWEYEENVLIALINEVPTIKMHANRASWTCISAMPANSGSNRANLGTESFSISR